MVEKEDTVEEKEDTVEEKTLNFINDFLSSSWDEQIKIFHLAEKHGIHLTKTGFYSPIPTVSELNDKMFEVKNLLNFNWNETNQLDLLKNLEKYSSEFKKIVESKKFNNENGAFELHDAPIYYSIIRHFQPSKIIEIGAGNSTKLAHLASEKNGKTKITSIDPFVTNEIEEKFSKSITIIKKPVQEINMSLFESLEKNDILFIDSSHISKVGSDVNFLFLEVLPILKPGVLIHVHDIFLPTVYPRSWLEENVLFWNEQFLLHALLIGNNNLEIILANYFLHIHHPEKLIEFYDTKKTPGGGSFWMQQKT